MILGGINSTSNAVAGTQSADDQARLEEDLNQFLTLLVTQLENQDPLDPMDSTEFTSQLVQFASVEQQIKQNTNLEQLVGLQQNNQISSMVNFIDKLVEVEGQSIPLEDGQAEFTYTLPVNAKSASIIIRPKWHYCFRTRSRYNCRATHIYLGWLQPQRSDRPRWPVFRSCYRAGSSKRDHHHQPDRIRTRYRCRHRQWRYVTVHGRYRSTTNKRDFCKRSRCSSSRQLTRRFKNSSAIWLMIEGEEKCHSLVH